jgi:uncharacterized protein YjbI with pentapeptide repeats
LTEIIPLGEPGNKNGSPSSPNDQAPYVRRAFSYQDHAGLTLLCGSLCDSTYTELWFEHHDDMIAVRADRKLDIYQVKTNATGDRQWRIKDSEIIKALTKFCELEDRFGDQISHFYLYSNIKAFVPAEHAVDEKRISESIVVLRHKIVKDGAPSLQGFYSDAFSHLLLKTSADAVTLEKTLIKLDFKVGKTLENFRPEAVSDIAATHPKLKNWSIGELEALSEKMTRLVISASSVDLPPITLYAAPITASGIRETEILSRKVTVAQLRSVIEKEIHKKAMRKMALIAFCALAASALFLYFRPSERDSLLEKAVQVVQSAHDNIMPVGFQESISMIRSAKKPLTGISWSGANLACQDLSDLDLRRMSGESMSSTGVIFDKSILAGSTLSRSEMNMAKFRNSQLDMVQFEATNLLASNFFGATARDANFKKATLNGANLSRASFKGSDFSNADLRLSEIVKSDMSEVNLKDAILEDTNISGSDFRKSKNLTQNMVNLTCNDRSSPPKLDLPLHPSNRLCSSGENAAFERKMKRIITGFVGVNVATFGFCKKGSIEFRPQDDKNHPQNNTQIPLDFSEIDDPA